MPKDHERYDKREVVAYIFLGDKCIDCLVLGSHNATITNPIGSIALKDKPDNRNKRVKISLFESKKNLQIVVKRLGIATSSERFGSVSISLRKLEAAAG